jgi:sortase A
MLWWRQQTDPQHGYVYKTATLNDSSANKKLKDIPQDNRLVIPQIQLDTQILEGTSPATLNNGLWHRPGTGSPSTGGNTVVAGHRLNYNGVASFFNLDKIKEGDVFMVYWQHKEYAYKVAHILTVSPLNLDVEKNTPDPMITLYTCTPLWTSNERLVIQAIPYKEAAS